MTNETAEHPSYTLHYLGSADDGFTSVRGFASIDEVKTYVRAEGLSGRCDEAHVTDARSEELDIDILAR